MENKIVVCKHCGCSLRLPLNKGMLAVTCPKCKYEFQFDSGRRPIGEFRESQYVSSAFGTTQSTSRTVTIRRSTHAYKKWDASGFRNILKDNMPVHIFLDDQNQGKLSKDGVMTIHLNTAAHTLKFAALGKKYRIPAGTDSYKCYFFENDFDIGPVNDSFRDKLTDFTLQIFRSKGIRDRMADPNNLNHNVEITVGQGGIRLSWRLTQTRGIKQWLTGAEEKNISYHQAGLTPLAKDRQPDGYWGFVNRWVRDAIESDEEADVEWFNNGFRVRTKYGH